MKVLFLSPYIYEPNLDEFSKCNSGFGMMVRDIFYKVSTTEEVRLITHVLTKGHCLICKHTLVQILSCLRKRDLVEALKSLIKKDTGFMDRLREAYYKIDKGYVKKTILDFSPDVIHLHGLGASTECYIEICEELNIPYLITLHGVIKTDPYASTLDQKIEKNYLFKFEKDSIPVSVISSGIKQKLHNDPYYSLKSTNNITVITNGIETTPNPISEDIREKYGIPKSAKVILAVGSVGRIKNQIQIIQAYSKLTNERKSNTWVILVGSVIPNYPIQEKICQLNIEGHIIITGFIPHKHLANYYSTADVVVLASIEEGFGLSLVEGFVYGTPCVAFADLDVVTDIYDKRSMLLCAERTDEALAGTIIEAIDKRWDCEWIKEYSKRFSLEKMKNEYIDLYKKTIDKQKNSGICL